MFFELVQLTEVQTNIIISIRAPCPNNMGGWGGRGTVTLQQRGDTGFLVEEANLSTFVGEDEDGGGG